MVHFNWTQLVVEHNMIHVATAAVATSLIILLSLSARLALGHGETAVAPAIRFSLKGVIEVILEFIVTLTDMVVGEKGRRFVPLFASLFLFVFINNILGLVPGMTPATDNVNTTLAVGIFHFLPTISLALKSMGSPTLNNS